MKKGDFVKVVKLSDDVFEGRHPNGIKSNHTVYGAILNEVKVGEALFLDKAKGDSFGFFHTSVITEIIDENTFRTLNSTYHIEMFDYKEFYSDKKNN